MTDTAKHNPFALPAVLVVWLTMALIGANGVVASCERHPAFASGRRNPLFFIARRTRCHGHDEITKRPRVVRVPFPNSWALDLSSGSSSSQMRQKRSDDDDDATADDDSIAIPGSVPKYWRTTPRGFRIVDDAIGRGEYWSEEIGMVARVRCETQILQQQRRERVVFLEPSPMDDSVVVLSNDDRGVTLLVVCNDNSLSTEYNDNNAGLRFSGLQEPLSGMRVGGRRRVLIPPTKNPLKVRFVGRGAAAVTDDETILMNFHLEALEPPSSWKAIVARTAASGGVPSALLSLFRPFLSPLGLLSFLCLAPLIVKKTVNAFAATELLYMDVDANAIYPIQALLEWKLKF